MTRGCLAATSTLEAPKQCAFGNTFNHNFSLSCTLLPLDAYWNIKRHERTHPKMLLFTLIFPLHWIPEGQLEEKIWRWQVIKPYHLLNYSSSFAFCKSCHKAGIRNNQSDFLKGATLIIQMQLLAEQRRSDSNKCKGKGTKHVQVICRRRGWLCFWSQRKQWCLQ